MFLILTATAALLSLLIALIHLILGGRDIALPLRNCTALPDEARSVAWMCWHLVTIQIFSLAALFAAGAFLADIRLTAAATLLSAAMTIWCLAAARILGQSYATMPQGWLFAPVTGLGAAAIFL